LWRGARLGPLWQTVSLFNPGAYLISGLRWAFYGAADVDIAVSTGMTLARLPDGGVVGVQDRMAGPALSLHAWTGANPGPGHPFASCRCG